jgi:glycerol uptake facilitator-like aquaporin
MSPLGAHFNPAVTLIFAARGATPWRDMLPHVIVQCAGGAVAPAFTQRSPNHVPGFIIVQLIGATCAALVAKALFEPAQSG